MSNQQRATRYLKVVFYSWLMAHGSSLAIAANPTAPRIFFSDASISFMFPNHWTLDAKFPYGPLFTKPTKKGGNAVISCAISAPLDNTHMSSDVSQEVLKQ